MSDGSSPVAGSAWGERVNFVARRVGAFALALRRGWRERLLARRISREALRLYREVEAGRPELTGTIRYQEIIARQTGLDRDDARRMVERAENDFASWPLERAVTFRDVVQYLVVQRWLATDPGAMGFSSRLTDIVAREIPDEL